MSLATLKKKTASKYQNNSVNLPQFSLNGVHRNQGFVGQTSLSRTTIYQNKTSTTVEQLKPSVVSTYGMLAKRNRWVFRPQPFSTTKSNVWPHESSSGQHTISKGKHEVLIKTDKCKDADKCTTDKCPKQKTEIPRSTISQGDYIARVGNICTSRGLLFT